MKRIFTFAVMAVIFSLMVGASSVSAYTIDDNYYGGTPTHNWGAMDVIGDNNYYDTVGMNIFTHGKTMTVDVFSSFVAQVNSQTIRDEQTQLGDLFIGTNGWHPTGTALNYANDTNSASDPTTAAKWNFAIVLNQHVPAQGQKLTGGTVSIYSTQEGKFVGSNIGTLETDSWVYRANQIVQFTPNSNAKVYATGTWNINLANEINVGGITYGDLKIDLSDYSGLTSTGGMFGFGWGMTCANDVIQGQSSIPAPVPEPGTMVMLGSGLLGLAIFSKLRMCKA